MHNIRLLKNDKFSDKTSLQKYKFIILCIINNVFCLFFDFLKLYNKKKMKTNFLLNKNHKENEEISHQKIKTKAFYIYCA